MNSPIRYFGGKGGMYKEILKYFPPEEQYHLYIEAFGGAASILFQKKPTAIEVYNDLEENVYSLFKVLSDDTLYVKFKEKCDLTYYSEQLRKEYIQSLRRDNLTLVERAYKYFVVNRTSRNGVGGFSFNIIIRRKMAKSVSDMLSAIDGLEQIHQRLSKVMILNQDAIKLFDTYEEDTFFYLDPPYHHSRRTMARYKVDMDNEKQKQLIDKILNSNAKILLSGYNNVEYERLLQNDKWRRIDFNVNTTDGNERPKVKTESLWLNYVATNMELFDCA